MSATPTHLQTTDQTVLIVAANPGGDLLAFGEQLASTGASVHFTTDVYAAMARLALGEPFSHVVVDAAALDGYDESFLSLAPQYFRDVEFHVPQAAAAANRMLPPGRFEPGAPAEIFDRIVGIREAEVADATESDEPYVGINVEHAVADSSSYADQNADATDELAPDHSQDAPADEVHEEKQHHDGPHGDPLEQQLSTDGGADHENDGPSLHDSVRQKMGGGLNPPPRRRPPGATDDAPPDPQQDARLSAEEMDALLGRNEESPTDEQEQVETDRDDPPRWEGWS